MSQTTNEGKIKFTYSDTTLFADVSLLSAYMAKNAIVESGSSVDEFSISDDEKEVYKVCVEQALPNVYEVLLKLNSNDDSFSYTKGDTISISIKDNDKASENAKALVDHTIYECIKYGVLAEFFSINTNPALYQMAKEKFASNLLLLNKRLFQLKKKH